MTRPTKTKREPKLRPQVETTFGPGGALARSLPGYKERPQQIELAREILDTFQTKTHLIAEAPTGVGKSLAALVPAFEMIAENDARVLVVTSSILLQGQYMGKDIPFLEELYGIDSGAVLIKGKQNYACAQRLASPAAAANVDPSRGGQLEHVRAWARDSETGDLSELPFKPAADVHRAVALTDPTDCKRKRCPFHSVCHYYNARSKVYDAKLVVCNYHYLFQAVQGEGSFEKMFGDPFDHIIFDEAHEIVGIARDFHASEVRPGAFDKAIQQVYNGEPLLHMAGASHLGHAFNEAIDYPGFRAQWDARFELLSARVGAETRGERDTLVFEGQRSVIDIVTDLRDMATKLDNILYTFLSRHRPDPDDEDVVKELIDWLDSVDALAQQVMGTKSALNFFLGHDVDEEQGYLRWFELYQANQQQAVKLVTKPTDMESHVGSLYDLAPSTVSMSATLVVGSSLDYHARQLGIPENQRRDLVVGTPFDLNANLSWYLPVGCPEGNRMEHADFAIPEMHKIARQLGGRTLCLFTSVRNLKKAKEYFARHPIPDVTVLAQDEYQRERIVDEMRRSDKVVVLATKSFFTGVDVQGRNLSAVLLDKIPFPMSGDPINEYLANLPSGFFRHTLPEAIITLKQAVGRLNRTEDDKGVIAVMDGRLSTKRYKQRIFNSFGFQVNGVREEDELRRRLEVL